jgi:Arc/MetJ-type ribon-helix-helix transcriptional regulator
MKSIHLDLPDKLAAELQSLVQHGWFQDEQEAVRVAVLEFLRQRRPELLERFQREDIEWALQQKPSSKRG